MNLIQLVGAVQIGLIYGLVALGVYLTFRVINFPDLTVDGSFPLGAAIAASLIVNNVNALLATFIAFLGGMLAGYVTGYLHVRWKILGLLAGILTMTGLYSINLRIMGRPNISLLMQPTVFSPSLNIFWILGGIVAIIVVLLIIFLNSDLGLAIRATGVNLKMSRAQGIRVNGMILLALGVSNGIVALAGALFAQSLGFADATLGPGTIIIGLASVIIGEVLFPTRRISLLVISCIMGSIVYRLTVAMALNAGDIGLQASDLKLITALLVTVTMVLPKIKASMASRGKAS